MIKMIDRDLAIEFINLHRRVSDDCSSDIKEICNLMHDQIIDVIQLLPYDSAIEDIKIRLLLARLRMNYNAKTQEARTAYLSALMDVERELFGDPGEAGR